MYEELLKGAVDLHMHVGPSVAKRIEDAVDAYHEAHEAGYRAYLVKDHYPLHFHLKQRLSYPYYTSTHMMKSTFLTSVNPVWGYFSLNSRITACPSLESTYS